MDGCVPGTQNMLIRRTEHKAALEHACFDELAGIIMEKLHKFTSIPENWNILLETGNFPCWPVYDNTWVIPIIIPVSYSHSLACFTEHLKGLIIKEKQKLIATGEKYVKTIIVMKTNMKPN